MPCLHPFIGRFARVASADVLVEIIGVPGSGSRDTFDEVMKAKGWTNADFALAGELSQRRWPQRSATTTST